MISCIICSRQPNISITLRNNIISSIGCEYEIVVIDNTENNFSIFSAYNEGVLRSNGDVLCFMHDDILYHTMEWGKKVEEYFIHYPRTGMLGVIGGHYLSSVPSGWWQTELRSGHLLQGYVENNQYKYKEDFWCSTNQIPTQVCAVDGLWMCIPRRIFNYIRWDDNIFTGFHGYDLDMSLQLWNAGYEVHVLWSILIEHKSMGMPSGDFYLNCEKVWKKHSNILPMVKGADFSQNSLDVRKCLVEQNNYIRLLEDKMKRIYSSKQYQLGNFLCRPLKFLRKFFVPKGNKIT